jgi:hypothetical protein
VDSINLCFFAGSDVHCTVGWQRWGRWSGAYGVAQHDPHEVWLHRALAWPSVPDYVVVHVLYHEMLHIRFGTTEHDERFALAERQAPHFVDFMRWDAYHGLAALALPRPSWSLIR